jgi:uncharacterized membrane protein HdeD (DUF308 family)
MRARAETKLIDEAAGDVFRRAWWAVALRGLTAIVLGIMMLTAPRPTFSLLVALLGIYVFIDGIFTLVAAFHAEAHGQNWWPYLLEGLLSIGVGLLAFARPGVIGFALLVLIGIRSIVVGLAEIATGVSVRRSLGTPTILLWLGGLASIAFGIVLLALPAVGVLALMWTAGVYALIFGVLLDTEAFRLRRYGSEHRGLEQATRST